MYNKNKLTDLNVFQVFREIRIHSKLDHKNIIQLVRPTFSWQTCTCRNVHA